MNKKYKESIDEINRIHEIIEGELIKTLEKEREKSKYFFLAFISLWITFIIVAIFSLF